MSSHTYTSVPTSLIGDARKQRKTAPLTLTLLLRGRRLSLPLSSRSNNSSSNNRSRNRSHSRNQLLAHTLIAELNAADPVHRSVG